jgi:hypothetical protein
MRFHSMLFGCGLIVLVCLCACTYNGRHSPEPPPVPIYPQMTSVAAIGTPVAFPGDGSDQEQVTTFTTLDGPDVVQNFYRDHLPDWGKGRVEKGGQVTAYVSSTCPFYGLTITTTPTSAGMTMVRVALSRTLCK